MALISVTNCNKIEDYKQALQHAGGEVRIVEQGMDAAHALEGTDGLLLAGGDMVLETASAACCRRNLAILCRAVRVCSQRGRGGSGVGGWMGAWVGAWVEVWQRLAAGSGWPLLCPAQQAYHTTACAGTSCRRAIQPQSRAPAPRPATAGVIRQEYAQQQ